MLPLKSHLIAKVDRSSQHPSSLSLLRVGIVVIDLAFKSIAYGFGATVESLRSMCRALNSVCRTRGGCGR